ncbi:tetracycline resistance protein, class B-like [Hydractinia symbiolongicarpus]|uniref:tetracycline resistance protein, class B-like n=1 Tax=Hydractinia symbiolongicarpus TaxID=13093 RepID=UPI00254C8B45|nr:tetracycline resistance protein, class B-like [Hydractinia symbiolongicarpus]XP_057306558.1 tetracycline resistance protein, class B-like [Hydractinia symbiolongicarpus]XP_057306559.1 tetracycline resistance protein, class B-like [Hydractinia symbiolongicarpus]XP_057306560.1 tetracycline resistance protein, class B-like [Hydractinia symbiolongicarpus]
MTAKKTKISVEDLKEWYKKRHRTFIAFTCQNTCLGMEYSLTFVTLWLYLEETLKASQLKLFYGLISAVYVTTQIAASIVIGYIFDKYRNTSSMFLIGNCFIVIGNAIYAIPYSPWNLFFGRLISGLGGCHRPIISSELARSYSNDELSSKFSIIGMAFGLGFVLGPGINFVFVKTDFFIGWLHITYTNAPACCLAVVFMLNQILVTCLVSDLSKEYNFKEQQTFGKEIAEHASVNNSDDESNALLLSNKNKNESCISVFIQLLKHTDTLIVLLSSFMFMYCMVSFDLWQPLANVKLMHWGILEINIIVFANGIASVVFLLFITYRPLNDHSMVYMSWICTLFVTLILIMYTVLAVYNSNLILNIVCWTCYPILFAILVIFDDVFLIGAMAKMTSSRVQTLTESIRLAFSRAGALTALLTAAISFTQLHYVCTCLAVLSYFGFLALVWRRKSLQNPVVIIK